MTARVTLQFRSRPYRKRCWSKDEIVDVDGIDEFEIRRKALDLGNARIGQAKVALVPAKPPKLKDRFFDADSGERFQGAYPGSDTEVTPFVVCQVIVMRIEVWGNDAGIEGRGQDH